MSGAERTEEYVAFARVVLAWHYTMEWSPDDPVPMCNCGRAAMTCPINAAARDAHLLPALSDVVRSGRAGIGPAGVGVRSEEGSDHACPVGTGGRS